MNDIEMARLQVEHNKEFWAATHRLAIDLHKLWMKSQLIEFGYRMSVLLVGTLFAYMCYRLFYAGAVNPAKLEAGGRGLSLTLDNAAPGIFFALFGTLMIITGIWRLLPLPTVSEPSVDLPSTSLSQPTDGSENGVSEREAKSVDAG